MAAYTAAVKRAKEKYEAKAYDRLSVVIMKGKKEEIRQAAAAAGVSVNAWISQAIDARLEKEGAEG
jgi:predicted HicB family RNase H-like nuclease